MPKCAYRKCDVIFEPKTSRQRFHSDKCRIAENSLLSYGVIKKRYARYKDENGLCHVEGCNRPKFPGNRFLCEWHYTNTDYHCEDDEYSWNVKVG